jgi:preprotein translocase subunit SecE
MAEAKKMTDTTSASSKELPAPAPRASRGVFQFFREVRREGIDKVTWPTFKETRLTTLMVFIMVGLTMLFFFVVDWVLAYGERLLIGAVS